MTSPDLTAILDNWVSWSKDIQAQLKAAVDTAQQLRDTDAAEDAAQAAALTDQLTSQVQSAFDAATTTPAAPEPTPEPTPEPEPTPDPAPVDETPVTDDGTSGQ